jgi:hypothetical protein
LLHFLDSLISLNFSISLNSSIASNSYNSELYQCFEFPWISILRIVVISQHELIADEIYSKDHFKHEGFYSKQKKNIVYNFLSSILNEFVIHKSFPRNYFMSVGLEKSINWSATWSLCFIVFGRRPPRLDGLFGNYSNKWIR